MRFPWRAFARQHEVGRTAFPGRPERPGKAILQRSLLIAAAVAMAVMWVTDALSGEILQRRRAVDPQRLNAAYGYPGATIDPVPLPGPRPYWGQALGATHYNWGYFGARHQHAQFTSHTGYYGEYCQFGYARGY